MKVVALICFLFASSVTAAASKAATHSPVEKVVQLIEELQKNLQRDQKVEQQIFDKFACWCQVATGNKAAAIHMAHMDIQQLGTTVLSLKSGVAVLAQDISDLSTAISENEEEQKQATSVRSKENGEYMQESQELGQAISALERAITVLSGAGTKTGLLQDSSALTSGAKLIAANLISVAVRALPAKANQKVTPAKMSIIERFTAVLRADKSNLKGMMAGGNAQIPEGVTAADSSASNSPQSATVQGILKDMYDSFSSDLESQTQQEAKSQRQFEDLIAQKVTEVNHKNKEMLKAEEKKAEKEVLLADAIQNLDDLNKQMKADIEFFDLTEAGCRAKHEEWTIRSDGRKEELAGIKEALEILSSDDARALFSKAIKPGVETSFLQTDSDNDDDANAPEVKAYKVLKEQAKKSKSLRLASLAAAVRLAGVGHFDKVIKAIDDMLKTLKGEEAEDIKQRDWCKDEYHEKAEQKAEIKWLITRNEAMIEKLDQKIAKIVEKLEDTVKEIETTHDQIDAMESERKEEHETFKQAKADDESAAELLGSAIEALSKYYKNKGIEMGPVQGSVKLLQEPEFEVSQWQAPDATFSDKGKRKNESKGIISILTMLKEDLEDEVKNGIKDEVSAQAEFEKQVNSAKALIKDLEATKVNLETEEAATNEKKTAEETDMSSNKEDLAANEEYVGTIKEGCDWALKSFEERRQKRAAEVAGLVKAKEFLAGAAPPAMLQTKFDDDKLSEIAFHGMAFLQK